MSGIQIDWSALEAAFENHAPDVKMYLDRQSGEVISIFTNSDDEDPTVLRVHAYPDQFLQIEPVPSREQYRMMEKFIETVVHEGLKTQLKDSIVGKGAFRRFKDAVGRHAEERKRWFAFRDVLLHRFIFDWLKQHRIELLEMPDWSVDLPEPAPAAEEPEEELVAPVDDGPRQDGDHLKAYLQAWARAHGEEYRYLFGPAAFERLAEDMVQEFSVFKRK